MNSKLLLITLALFLIPLAAQVVLAQDASEFIAAVTGGDIAKVKQMIAANPKLARAADKDGASAILKAVYYRKKEVVDFLLSIGPDLDIFEASALGKTARVEELLTKDKSLANRFAPDGFHPLGLAAFFSHRDTVEVLLNAGARVNVPAQNKLGVTALHSAAAAGRIDIARLLIDRGADVNASHQGQFTALHAAATTGQLELATLLLDRGAEINARSAMGKTALAYAVEAGQSEVAKLLESRGAVK
jgi:ankyrin repeat protein